MGHINLQKCRIFFCMYIYTFQHANIFIRVCFSLLDPDGMRLTYVYTYIHMYTKASYVYLWRRGRRWVWSWCNRTPLLTQSDVCVYVCMCVWVYVCMCVYVYVCMCVCVYVCMCVQQDLHRSIATSEMFLYIKSHTPITYIYKKWGMSI